MQEDQYQQDIIVVEDEALRAGFTQIPNAVLRRPDVTPGAKLAYMALLSYAWQQGSCFPGQETLAHDMGVSRRSVVTYLQQLQETGLLRVRRRGLGQTNIYTLPRLNSPELAPSRMRSAKSALLEVQNLSPLEVQNLHAKKTQSEEDPDREDSAISSKERNSNVFNSNYAGVRLSTSFRTQSIVDNAPAGELAEDTPQLPLDPKRPSSVGQILAQRYPHGPAPVGSNTTPSRGRPPKAPEFLAATMEEITHRLNDDRKNVRSNTTRATKLWKTSGLPEDKFVTSVLYKARSLAQQQGNVTKRAGAGAGGIINRVPYFFAVVEDLLGLKGSAADPS